MSKYREYDEDCTEIASNTTLEEAMQIYEKYQQTYVAEDGLIKKWCWD